MSDFYGATSLIGGAVGALDAIDGSELADLDGAVVITDDKSYLMRLDADNAGDESSPLIITPDDNPGNKRWVLNSLVCADVELPNGATIGVSSGDATLRLDTDYYLYIGYLKLGGETRILTNHPDANRDMTINAQGTGGVHFNKDDGGSGGVSFYDGGGNHLIRFMGSLGYGSMRIYDQDAAEYLDIKCVGGAAFFDTKGSSPGLLYLQGDAQADIQMFHGAVEGETKLLKIYGRRTGDSKRALTIGVGVDRADMASFDGVGGYLFNGHVGISDNPTTTFFVAHDSNLMAEEIATFLINNRSVGVAIKGRSIVSTGSDTNVRLEIDAKGSESLRLQTISIGNVGINVTSPTAKLHIDQSSDSGAIPVLKLDQGDVDDSFVDFIGTSAADGSRSISSDTTEDSAKFGAIRIEINSVTKWIRIYDNES